MIFFRLKHFCFIPPLNLTGNLEFHFLVVFKSLESGVKFCWKVSWKRQRQWQKFTSSQRWWSFKDYSSRMVSETVQYLAGFFFPSFFLFRPSFGNDKYWQLIERSLEWKSTVAKCISLSKLNIRSDSLGGWSIPPTRVSVCMVTSKWETRNCKGPHAIHAANVGSTRDLISPKNCMKTSDRLQGWYYVKNVSRHQHDKNR